MFDVLHDYKVNEHFFLTEENKMEEVCNAPKSGLGVYLVYELKQGRINLVYVGAAGKISHTGKKKGRENLFEELVKQGESWKKKIIKEKIEALDIYWYETYNNNVPAIPAFVQAQVIQAHFDMQGKLPAWNKEF